MWKKILSKLLLLTAAICFGLIAGRLLEYKKADGKEEEIAGIMAGYFVEDPMVSVSTQRLLPFTEYIDIRSLKEEYPDTTGYLFVPGTKINYPVVNDKDDGFYLDHAFDGSKSIYGCLYKDKACYEGGINTVIYGHNIRSGRMFGELDNYLDNEYLQEHQYIYYVQENGIKEYQLCAVLKAPATDETILYNLAPYTKSEFNNLKSYINENNLTKDSIEWGDELITLATCEYTNRDGRLYIIGKLSDTFAGKK